MKDKVILLLVLAAIPLFMLSLALLSSVGRSVRRGTFTPRRRLMARLAFGCASLILLAHRAGLTWMLLSWDFTDSNVQAGFGMTWWFLDPLAGFPVILGTMPFTSRMPMPQFIHGVYIPLSILLYAAIIYLLWLLARPAFRPAPDNAGTSL